MDAEALSTLSTSSSRVTDLAGIHDHVPAQPTAGSDPSASPGVGEDAGDEFVAEAALLC